MKKVVVWGFRTKTAETIRILKAKGICEIVAWFGRSKDCDVHLHDINECKIEISEYKSYDKELYDRVHKDFLKYFICHNREKHTFQRKYKFYDYIDFFNIYFQKFYDLLSTNRPDLIIFHMQPHLGADYILYKMAKEMNIKTLIMYFSQFPNRFVYFFDYDDFGVFNGMKKKYSDEHISIEKGHKRILLFVSSLKFFNKFGIPKPRFFNKIYSMIMKIPQLSYHIEYKKNLKNIITKDIDLNKKFVYFPLHFQPELTTYILGGIYNDQILAIEKLSELLPEDWYIYAKENPIQTEYMRGKGFFKRLKAIKNLVVVPTETSTYTLIEKSQFIATITGSVGWEGISGGKPVMTFGQVWYKNFPGVIEYRPDIDINEIVNYKINHEELENAVSDLVNRMPYGIVEQPYKEMVENYDDNKNNEMVADFLADVILGE